jgi:hypothetical protein
MVWRCKEKGNYVTMQIENCDIRHRETCAMLSWCSAKGISVSCKWVPGNPAVVRWFLQRELSWCSVKGIGLSYRFVPSNIISKLVLRGDWCLLQIGAYKHCNSGLVPTSFYKKSFVVFSHLGFQFKSLCTTDFMVVYLSLNATIVK